MNHALISSVPSRLATSNGQPLSNGDRCAVPSERNHATVSIPGVAPRAVMRCPVGAPFDQLGPNGATAYQRRALPWFTRGPSIPRSEGT